MDQGIEREIEHLNHTAYTHYTMCTIIIIIALLFITVERYTGAGRDDKRRNFGTLRKKVRRLNQSLVQKTGLRTAVSNIVWH